MALLAGRGRDSSTGRRIGAAASADRAVLRRSPSRGDRHLEEIGAGRRRHSWGCFRAVLLGGGAAWGRCCLGLCIGPGDHPDQHGEELVRAHHVRRAQSLGAVGAIPTIRCGGRCLLVAHPPCHRRSTCATRVAREECRPLRRSAVAERVELAFDDSARVDDERDLVSRGTISTEAVQHHGGSGPRAAAGELGRDAEALGCQLLARPAESRLERLVCRLVAAAKDERMQPRGRQLLERIVHAPPVLVGLARDCACLCVEKLVQLHGDLLGVVAASGDGVEKAADRIERGRAHAPHRREHPPGVARSECRPPLREQIARRLQHRD